MRQTLLIVEDSELNRDLLVQLFEDEYEIRCAADGETAVELAATAAPDLILMDIGLPGRLSGLDAVRAMQALVPCPPVVAVSSHVMPDDRADALDAGCVAFIPKPIDDVLLVATVKRLLGRQ
jgi:two-component system, cell cycle response regulator DivK